MTDRIDIAKEREKLVALEGFTPGPWELVFSQGATQIMTPNLVSLMCDETYYPWVPDNLKDWSLIAAAPDLLATNYQLLDALDAKDAEIERLREETVEARLEGWRAGLETAAAICDGTAKYHMSDPDDIEVVRLTATEIRNQPIPKEFKNEY